MALYHFLNPDCKGIANSVQYNMYILHNMTLDFLH